MLNSVECAQLNEKNFSIVEALVIALLALSDCKYDDALQGWIDETGGSKEVFDRVLARLVADKVVWCPQGKYSLVGLFDAVQYRYERVAEARRKAA